MVSTSRVCATRVQAGHIGAVGHHQGTVRRSSHFVAYRGQLGGAAPAHGQRTPLPAGQCCSRYSMTSLPVKPAAPWTTMSKGLVVVAFQVIRTGAIAHGDYLCRRA